MLASPLLAIAGFYDPPFILKAESIQIEIEDLAETLQGRLDALANRPAIENRGYRNQAH